MNISNPHLTNAPNTGKISPRARAHITRGDVAQLGEHHVRNVGVVGSNPIISTTETRSGARPMASPPIFIYGLPLEKGVGGVNGILEFLQTCFVSRQDEDGSKPQRAFALILIAVLVFGVVGMAIIFFLFPPSIKRIFQEGQDLSYNALCACVVCIIAPILILRSMRISAVDGRTDYSKEITPDDYIMIDEVARVFGIAYRADEVNKLKYLRKTVVSGHKFNKPGTTWMVENCLPPAPVEMRNVAGVLMPAGDRKYYRFNARPIVPESLGFRSITVNNYGIGATTTIEISEGDNATLKNISHQLEQMNELSRKQIHLLSSIVEKVNTEGSITSEEKDTAKKVLETSKDLLVNILGGAAVSLLEKLFLF